MVVKKNPHYGVDLRQHTTGAVLKLQEVLFVTNQCSDYTVVIYKLVFCMLFQWNSSMLDAVLNLRITSHLKSSLDWSDRGLFKYVTCLVAIFSIFYFHKIKTGPKDFSIPA